jgi:hypothetical protein
MEATSTLLWPNQICGKHSVCRKAVTATASHTEPQSSSVPLDTCSACPHAVSPSCQNAKVADGTCRVISPCSSPWNLRAKSDVMAVGLYDFPTQKISHTCISALTLVHVWPISLIGDLVNTDNPPDGISTMSEGTTRNQYSNLVARKQKGPLWGCQSRLLFDTTHHENFVPFDTCTTHIFASKLKVPSFWPHTVLMWFVHNQVVPKNRALV